MTDNEDTTPPSRLVLQEALSAVFNAKESLQRIWREQYPIGSEVRFIRNDKPLSGTVISHGVGGNFPFMIVQIATPKDRKRVSPESIIKPTAALQDALDLVDSAQQEVERVLHEEYPPGVGVVFVRASKREHGVVEEIGERGQLTVKMRDGRIKRIGAHEIRA